MIRPWPLEADLKFQSSEKKELIRSIRSLYSKSGLYRNDGSNEPLWTVDWFSPDVEIASDGMHLVRFRRDAYSINNEAISFYAKSELLRTYTIRELIDIPILLEYHDNDFNWIEKLDIDDKKLKCTLTTKDGNQFLFDMNTGELISETHSWRWLVGGVLLFTTVMLCGLGWMIERRRKPVIVRFPCCDIYHSTLP